MQSTILSVDSRRKLNLKRVKAALRFDKAPCDASEVGVRNPVSLLHPTLKRVQRTSRARFEYSPNSALLRVALVRQRLLLRRVERRGSAWSYCRAAQASSAEHNKTDAENFFATFERQIIRRSDGRSVREKGSGRRPTVLFRRRGGSGSPFRATASPI